MGCTESNHCMSHRRLVMAHWKYSSGPEVFRSGETDEIDDGDGAEMVEEEPFARATEKAEARSDVWGYATRLTTSDGALACCRDLGDFLSSR